MKRVIGGLLPSVVGAALIGVSCLAGDNIGATVEMAPMVPQGDTLSYRILVNSAVGTRVVHLMFRVPEGVEFLSWEDGDFIGDPLRIGPEFHVPSRRLLVALAAGRWSIVADSSGEVGVARFLRNDRGAADVDLLEACLVDAQLREDWVVTPGISIHPSSPGRVEVPVPLGFALRNVSPNPMERTTHVEFEIPRPGSSVTVKIYDVTGRAVRTLVDGQRAPGYYSEVWDLSNDGGLKVAPGIYFCRMEAGTFRDTKKLVVLR